MPDFKLPPKIATDVHISMQDVLQICLFGNLVVILVSSNNLQKIVRSTCGSKDVAMRICSKKLKN